MNRCVGLIFWLLWLTACAFAHPSTELCHSGACDTIGNETSTLQKNVDAAYKVVKSLNHIDTLYIEPQHFNYTVMLQNTNTYEVYRLNDNEGHSITFAPRPSVKIGPYFGWRWLFLGYTIDVSHLGDSKTKEEYDLSLYSSKIGIDLFYRKSGNDYLIREMDLGKDINTSAIKNAHYDGLNASIKGFNVYYIFNHRRFSYPAAFSQSTVQRISCGSPLVGIGYTRHSLSVDWNKLGQVVEQRLGTDVAEERINKSLMFEKIQYTDVSVSGGYAYNWVFARNWLFASSLSLALAYKRTKGDSRYDHFTLRNFTIKNFNLDGVGRFGIVWNNTRWYAGTSAIMHAYNYNKKEFSTNNIFGSINIYVGFNFMRRR
ncbi:MAG: DUF4421 domain-containing protein [Prevotella sp.]|nr:DUF4421 domain-containing protein [Prevotella sp.]